MSNANLYRLMFMDDCEADVEFEAEDAFKALVLAHDKATDQSAELWLEDRKLCSIRRVRGEVWRVQSAQAEAPEHASA